MRFAELHAQLAEAEALLRAEKLLRETADRQRDVWKRCAEDNVRQLLRDVFINLTSCALEESRAETAQLREKLAASERELARVKLLNVMRAKMNVFWALKLDENRAALGRAESALRNASWVLNECKALVISTDAVGPVSMNGKPQIVSSTTALAAAEWARRAQEEAL